ncbi:MAG: 7-carboxy-7-deazaguanine synthase QueE [Planctomycetaceae bacterium]|nr:7-carboxy-7-deazaguanine synthase QueE [Planctomycetaceae bacterium]
MRVIEIFASRQGEGLWTGQPSAFVRLGACHLRCRFCDTPYAAWVCEPGEQLSVDETVERVVSLQQPHVVITGGEPLLFSETVELTERFDVLGFKITIETSGTVDQPVRAHLMSISPKLSNSTPNADNDPAVSNAIIQRHEVNRRKLDATVSYIERYNYQIKFVVDTPDDLPEIEQFLERFPKIEPGRVLLMPQGVTRNALTEREHWLRPYAESRGYVFCQRMQIFWYGNQRGT